MFKNKVCGECLFAVANEFEPRKVYCKRYPPTNVGFNGISVYIEVLANNSACGDFEIDPHVE